VVKYVNEKSRELEAQALAGKGPLRLFVDST